MINPKKNRCRIISIVLSFISLILTGAINYQIAKEYLRVDRKMQLLFGIKELLQFGYQYYVSLFGLAALIFAILSVSQTNLKAKKPLLAICISLLSIIAVFARPWRLFI